MDIGIGKKLEGNPITATTTKLMFNPFFGEFPFQKIHRIKNLG